jgi:hypothetical protein
MRKTLLSLLAIFIAASVSALTPAGSFECHIRGAAEIPAQDIGRYISQLDLENYRLLNTRTTLKFDNGFEIVLLSAAEAQSHGLISSTASYSASFIPKFILPVFHMTADGKVSAAYPVHSKYTSHNR